MADMTNFYNQYRSIEPWLQTSSKKTDDVEWYQVCMRMRSSPLFLSCAILNPITFRSCFRRIGGVKSTVYGFICNEPIIITLAVARRSL